MPRPSRDTRDQLLRDSRQKLLDSATQEIAAHGYVGANINRISLAAGFSKATVYNYFASKRALMLELIDEIAAAHFEYIQAQVTVEQGTYKRLEEFFRAGFDFVKVNPSQARVVINAVYGHDAEFKAHLYQAYQPLFSLIIEEILQSGIDLGDLRRQDVDLSAALVMSIYLGGASQIDDKGEIWIDPAEVTRFIFEGISTVGKTHPSE